MVPDTRHVTQLLALLLAEIANEILKILSSLLVDLQKRILPGIHWACQIFPSPFTGRDSQWITQEDSTGWGGMRLRDEGPGGIFLCRFYFSKCLAFPGIVAFRWLFHDDPRVNPWWLLDSQMTQEWPRMTPEWPPRTKRTQDDSWMRVRGEGRRARGDTSR